MARRLISRLAQGLLVVFAVVTLTFVLQFVLPGDPAKALVPRAGGDTLERIRKDLGLDDPLLTQFGRYLRGLLGGDLGTSYLKERPVSSLIAERFPATAVLALSAAILQVLIGGAMGILASVRRSAGKVVTAATLVLFSTPSFTLGLLLLLFFGFRLHVLPVSGGAGLPQLILPALTLGLSGAPWYAQVVREQMAESLSSAYVRTAVAKGVPDRRIIRNHSLRNVLPPVLSLVGLDLAYLLSGVAVVESVFSWPGIGQLTVNSIAEQDRPVALGIVLVGTVAIVLFNLLVDILQASVDPRTRRETR